MMYLVCDYRFDCKKVKCLAASREEARAICNELIAYDIEHNIHDHLWTVVIKKA